MARLDHTDGILRADVILNVLVPKQTGPFENASGVESCIMHCERPHGFHQRLAPHVFTGQFERNNCFHSPTQEATAVKPWGSTVFPLFICAMNHSIGLWRSEDPVVKEHAK